MDTGRCEGGSGKSAAAPACATSRPTYVSDNDALADHGPEASALGTRLDATEPWSAGKEFLVLDGTLRESPSVGVPLEAAVLPRVTEGERATLDAVAPAIRSVLRPT